MDDTDPALIRLIFNVIKDGHESRATARARYEHGHVTLLDPIPDGATPST